MSQSPDTPCQLIQLDGIELALSSIVDRIKAVSFEVSPAKSSTPPLYQSAPLLIQGSQAVAGAVTADPLITLLERKS